eukprot:GHVU01087036.1.p3 GENE.GHVU01087036.1~~GHVU01087036.1.p3  ORF type:complete len:108 (+),score=7.57 GHVU01087036.1:1146-1469(+)
MQVASQMPLLSILYLRFSMCIRMPVYLSLSLSLFCVLFNVSLPPIRFIVYQADKEKPGWRAVRLSAIPAPAAWYAPDQFYSKRPDNIKFGFHGFIDLRSRPFWRSVY